MKWFREVRGGWSDPSELPELVAWAKKLGVPADLAKCFAETVTEDNDDLSYSYPIFGRFADAGRLRER